jgi:hypothetical protein
VARVALSDLLPAAPATGGMVTESLGAAIGIDPSLEMMSDSMKGNPKGRVVVAVVAVLTVGASLAVAVTLVPDTAYSAAPAPAVVDGLTIFALFFTAAFAIERLLEPISKLLLPKAGAADDLARARKEAAKAGHEFREAKAKELQLRSSQHHDALAQVEKEAAQARATAQDRLNEAAAAVAVWEDRINARTVMFWAVATGVAIFASAALHLYFLRTIGATSADRWLEVLATGLIVGAGTKPLHDVTSSLLESKT